MAQSLLAFLYPHIRGSQEDIATLSLQHIVSQNEELLSTFNKLVADRLRVDLSDVKNYICQATGENLERPDLSGTDIFGNEKILCEAKFYAGLTENQPVVYLERLKNENGKGLIFICPQQRITGLWNELKERCKHLDVEVVNDTCCLVNGIAMSIITWSEIIYELKYIAENKVRDALSNLEQLEGYCNQMDRVSFIPFSSEELGAITARKQQRYYQVIDETVERILADKTYIASIDGKKSRYEGGYERKLFIDDYFISIVYDENLWMNLSSKETPFWVAIKNKEKSQDENVKKVLSRLPNHQKDKLYSTIYMALEPLANATLDDVAEDLKKQIYRYLNMFN